MKTVHIYYRHYVKGYFFIDFISTLPYMWFYPTRILPPGPDSNSVLLIVEFLPILKIIRIPTVRRNVQHINAVIRTFISRIYKNIPINCRFEFCKQSKFESFLNRKFLVFLKLERQLYGLLS